MQDRNMVVSTNPFDVELPGDVVVVSTNRKLDRHKGGRRLQIMVVSTTDAKLHELAATHGYTVGALVRHCIDRQLLDLEKWLDKQSAPGR